MPWGAGWCVPAKMTFDCKKDSCEEGKYCKAVGKSNICAKSPLPPKAPATPTEAGDPARTNPEGGAPTKPIRPRPRPTRPTATTPVGCDAKCKLDIEETKSAALEKKLAALDTFRKQQAAARQRQIEFLKKQLAASKASEELKKLQGTVDALQTRLADDKATAAEEVGAGNATSSVDDGKDVELKEQLLEAKKALAVQKEKWAQEYAQQQVAEGDALQNEIAALTEQLATAQQTSAGGEDDAETGELASQIEFLQTQLEAANLAKAKAEDLAAASKAQADLLQNGAGVEDEVSTAEGDLAFIAETSGAGAAGDVT